VLLLIANFNMAPAAMQTKYLLEIQRLALLGLSLGV
jgi:hypothetical protein